MSSSLEVDATQPVIQSTKLRGHQGAVLSLDHSSSTATSGGGNSSSPHHSDTTPFATAACLLSGSEDGTCRVWDLRASSRAAMCIKCPKSADGDESSDVLSVAFGPKWYHEATQEPAQTDQSSPFARDFSIYTAVGNHVYGYDLRYNASPIITRHSTEFPILSATDEINQIVFSPTRRRLPTRRDKKNANVTSSNLPSFLAAADDTGSIRVTESWQEEACGNQCPQTRVYNHGNDAMVTSLAFCPRYTTGSNGKESARLLLASGGTDCCVQLWSTSTRITTSAEPMCSVSMSSVPGESDNQVCNPPMVHSLNWSPSGALLAAGLGDGSVALMLLQQSSPSCCRLVLTSRLHDAHSGTVASCLFPEWITSSTTGATASDSNHALTSHDRLLCTAGNDGCIVLWDLGATVGGSKAANPSHVLKLSGDDKRRTSRRNQTGDEIDQPQTVYTIQHTAKPNWIVSSRGRDPFLPSALFVADTSNDITVYSIPLQ